MRDQFSGESGNPAVDATRAMNGYVNAEQDPQERVGKVSIRRFLGEQHVFLGRPEAYFNHDDLLNESENFARPLVIPQTNQMVSQLGLNCFSTESPKIQSSKECRGVRR